jgi:hypothetical protein
MPCQIPPGTSPKIRFGTDFADSYVQTKNRALQTCEWHEVRLSVGGERYLVAFSFHCAGLLHTYTDYSGSQHTYTDYSETHAHTHTHTHTHTQIYPQAARINIIHSCRSSTVKYFGALNRRVLLPLFRLGVVPLEGALCAKKWICSIF